MFLYTYTYVCVSVSVCLCLCVCGVRYICPPFHPRRNTSTISVFYSAVERDSL